MKKVISTCPFCGTGCSIILNVEDGKIVKIEGNKESTANKGLLCVKGLSCHQFVQSPFRLKKPLIKKEGKFREASWNEAIKYVAENFKRILKKHGARSFGILNSARCTNEENYLMYEFATKVLQTQNVDQCARLCHMPSGIAYAKMFGIGAMSIDYENIENNSKVIMICGANPAEEHPIIFQRMLAAKKKGAKIIVVDPRKSATAKHADIHVAIEEGKDDAFYIAIIKYLIQNDLVDKEMLKRTEDFDFFLEELKPLDDVDALCQYAGVDSKLVGQIAELIAKNPSVFINGLGLTESAGCVTNVELLGCIALLTGNLGKLGTGVAPLRGQSNVQGASDIQVMYFRKLKFNPETRMCYFEKKFDRSLSSTEMIEGVLTDQINCMYIMGENPAVGHPNTSMTIEALKKIDFLVVQDIFMSETAEYADVVLPGATFAEKSGSFTNSERRVQLVNQAIKPVGESKPDWEIICLLGKAMGDKKNFNYKNAKEIWQNVRKDISLYAGITYEAMRKNHGIFFPCFNLKCDGSRVCNEDILYKSFFYTKNGKAVFPAVRIYPPTMIRNEKFPFRLLTGGILAHYRTGTVSRRCPTLNKMVDEPYVEINPNDAKEKGVKDGDMLEISAPNGKKIKAKAKISTDVKPKYIFIPLHFREARVNMLTSSKLIDISKTPDYKDAIVNIKKI